jgi:hypothetical protein
MCFSTIPPSMAKALYQQQYYDHMHTNEDSSRRSFTRVPDNASWKHGVISPNDMSSMCQRLKQLPPKKKIAMLLQQHRNVIKIVLTDTPVHQKQRVSCNFASSKNEQNDSRTTEFGRKRRHDYYLSTDSHLSTPLNTTDRDNSSHDSGNCSSKRLKNEAYGYLVAAETENYISAAPSTNVEHAHASVTSSCSFHIEQTPSQQQQYDTPKSSALSPSMLSLMRELCSWENCCQGQPVAIPMLKQLHQRGKILQRLYDSRENKLQQAFSKFGIDSTQSTRNVSSQLKYKCNVYQSQHQHTSPTLMRKHKEQRHVHFADIARVVYPRHSQSQSTAYLSLPPINRWYRGDEIHTNNSKCRELIQKYITMYSHQHWTIALDDDDDDDEDTFFSEYKNDTPIDHDVDNVASYDRDTTHKSHMNFIGLEKKIVLPIQLQILHRFLAKKHVGMVLCLQKQQKQQRLHESQMSDNIVNYEEKFQNELAYLSYVTSFSSSKRANRTALLLHYELENY